MRALLTRVLPVVLLALSPTVVLAAAPKNFKELADLFVTLLYSGTGLLITAAVVIYLYGISRSLFKAGQEGKDSLRTYFLWGIITIFIMVSIWGILQLLQNTFFGAGGGAGPANVTFSPSDGGVVAPDFNEN